MKNYKYLRILVCLLLVCCLIVNISPIKAHATAAAIIPAVVPVSAPLVIGAVLIGLGISYGISSGAFYNLIESCSTALSGLGEVIDGKINVYVNNGRSYVDPSIIRNVRGHLFSSSVLTEELDKSSSLTAGTTFDVYTLRRDCYAFVYQHSGLSTLILIPHDLSRAWDLVVRDDGSYPSNSSIHTSRGWIYYISFSASLALIESLGLHTISNSTGINAAIESFFAGEYDWAPKTVVTTELDVTLSGVVPSTTTFEEAYATWSDLSLNTSGDSGDEDMPAVIYPISVPESEMNFSTITQEDVWAGGTMSVPGTGTGTGTGSGTISGTVTLPGWVQDGFNNLNNGLKDILNSLLSLPAALAAAIWALLPEWIQDGFYNMKTGFLDVLDSLAALSAAIWSSLPAWLRDGISEMKLGFSDVLDSIASLPVAIAEALAAVFVPSADYISVKVEALRGEFGFVDSVITTGEFIRDSISGASGPPVIYVDLGRAPSGNYGSQRVLLTDFSWYAPYKGQVDTVLSAALWAFFGWRVFLKLPGIIGGESGYISDVFFPSSSGRSGSDDKKKGGKG